MSFDEIYSLASVAGITLASLGTILIFPCLHNSMVLAFFVAFSAGSLLGDVVFHLFQEVESLKEISLCFSLLAGIGFLWGLEWFIRTVNHSHHHEGCSSRSGEAVFYSLVTVDSSNSTALPITHRSSCTLETPNDSSLVTSILIGDGLHNFVDGIAIGVSFIASWKTGIATSLAILCHEIPHELADYAVMIKAGLSRKKAFFWCCMANLSAFAGVLLAPWAKEYVKLVLAFTIGTFLYISLADLVPEMLLGTEQQQQQHKQQQNRRRNFIISNVGMIMGILLMLVLRVSEEEA